MSGNYTTADQSHCIRFSTFIVCTGVGKSKPKGGGKMVAKKVSKAAPKIPKGKIGKAVKRK